VLGWSEALIDGHATRLVLDRTAHSHMRRMATLLVASSAAAEEMTACLGMTQQAEYMPCLSFTSDPQEWRIEVLDLRVDKNV
jgi:hypothetical protein